MSQSNKNLMDLVDTTKYKRDINSKALIFTDVQEKNKFIINRDIQKKTKDNIDNLNNRINKIEDDLTEIKKLLLQVLYKKSDSKED